MKQKSKSRKFLIEPGEIHAWLVKINIQPQFISELEIFLSEEEHTRSRLFKAEKDRWFFIARRGILRWLLGQYCALPPSAITFQVNPFGKLSLPSSSTSFNISHSQDVSIFCFSHFPEIGVDIEQVIPKSDLSQMAEHWFSSEEQASLSILPVNLQTEAFYHIWTQKEAYIKARGLGLSIPLKDFSVSSNPRKTASLLSIGRDSDDLPFWKLIDLPVNPGWRAAICVNAQWYDKILFSKSELQDFFIEGRPQR